MKAVLAVVGSLSLRQFEGEAGAVIFNPVGADTHLVGDAALQMLEWLGQLPLPLDREQAVASLLAECASDQVGADEQALTELLDELLRSGLLVELTP